MTSRFDFLTPFGYKMGLRGGRKGKGKGQRCVVLKTKPQLLTSKVAS
jgi:hypothetical protein